MTNVNFNPLTTYAAVREYALKGWHLLPLDSAVIKPSELLDPVSQAGVLAHATPDLRQIKQWFLHEGCCRPALKTGSISGLIVVEVDPTAGGAESLRKLERCYDYLPATNVAVTESGKRLYFFRHTGTAIVGDGAYLPGIRVYGEDQWVPVPVSLSAKEGLPAWVNGYGPQEHETSKLPACPGDWISGTMSPLGAMTEQEDSEDASIWDRGYFMARRMPRRIEMFCRMAQARSCAA